MISHLSNFEQYLTLRGLSPSAIAEIKRDISLVERYLIPIKLEYLEQKHLEGALLSLKQAHNLKNVSLNRKISSLRSFFAFLHERDILSTNPAASLPYARRIKNPHPTYLGKAELRQILAASSCNPFHNTIIHTYYELALRLSELINLQISDIDSSSMQARIFGKGRKVRHLPFSSELLAKWRIAVKTHR